MWDRNTKTRQKENVIEHRCVCGGGGGGGGERQNEIEKTPQNIIISWS